MIVPEGFASRCSRASRTSLQPIAFCIDDRGRLWVAEASSTVAATGALPEGPGQDRILIFDDTDGDGKYDKRTVFFEA